MNLQLNPDEIDLTPDRNVYILGAGFSATAGAPLVNDFLDRARRLADNPSSPLDIMERFHFHQVFKFRREMAQAREKVILDLDNIENLFGLVEISNRLSERQSGTRDSTVYMIAKTLQLEIEAGGKGFSSFNIPILKKNFGEAELIRLGFVANKSSELANYCRLGIYDYFAGVVCGIFNDKELNKTRKDTVITFNYDLVFERALKNLQYDANYHLNPDIANDERGTPPLGTCDVLKLHGSTNWGVCSACNKSVVILGEKVTGSPRDFRGRTCPKCEDNKFTPFLIPPSWDKSEYRQIIAPVWKKAVDELKRATRICIIGYSVPETDAFFKYLLTMALAENHKLYSLTVVDYKTPDDELAVEGTPAYLKVKERYEALLEPLFQRRRFEFSAQGLYHFLQSPKSRERLERGEAIYNTLLET